jgi:glycosyltransferase involved in cell wall biosynthesis
MAGAKKVCIVGPLTPPDDGTVIPTRVFLEQLFKRLPEDRFRLVNTYTGDKSETGLLKLSVLLGLAKVVAKMLYAGTWSDLVIVFGSQRFVATLGASCACIFSLFGKPVCVRVYGGAFDEYLDGLGHRQRAITLWMMRRYTNIVIETELVRRNLLPYFGDRLAIAPNDRNRPCRTRQRRCDAEEVTLLYCGIVRKQKGIRELVGAFRQLRSQTGGKRLRLIAMGRIHSDIKDFIQSERLADDQDIEFPGQCSEDEVLDALCASDILVLPTYWPTEGHSGTLIEGLMLGIPIVATRWRANEEVIENGVTGLLCEPRNSDDLADKLKTLIDDPGVRRELSRNAIDRSTAFSSETVCEHLVHEFGLLEDQRMQVSGA